MGNTIVCPVCGFRYENTPEGACGPCPLHAGCAMACCPACGHTTIDTGKSSLAGRLQRWFRPPVSEVQDGRPIQVADLYLEELPDRPAGPVPPGFRLDQVQPGEAVEIVDFGPGLSPQHRLRLQAFGLEPGYRLDVIQQRPVTIVRIDQIELAVERVLAAQVVVRRCAADQ